MTAPASARVTTSVPAGDAVQLRPLGRIAVVALTLPGLAVASLSDFGLLWFVPYAGAGAVLAIRRPRTSIGWLLLALAWALAFAGIGTVDPSTLPVDAVPALPDIA